MMKKIYYTQLSNLCKLQEEIKSFICKSKERRLIIGITLLFSSISMIGFLRFEQYESFYAVISRLVIGLLGGIGISLIFEDMVKVNNAFQKFATEYIRFCIPIFSGAGYYMYGETINNNMLKFMLIYLAISSGIWQGLRVLSFLYKMGKKAAILAKSVIEKLYDMINGKIGKVEETTSALDKTLDHVISVAGKVALALGVIEGILKFF